MDLRVRLHCGAVLHRSMQSGSLFEVCAVVNQLSQRDLGHFESKIRDMRLVACSHEAKGAHSTMFTNICGKIVLVPGRQIYQPGVQPFVATCTDGFGKSTALFSPHCNLSTHEKNTATLFRGATCTHAVQTVIEHAICADAISRITVHMLVATARLGRNVSMHCYLIEHDLARDPRWTATPIAQLDHMSYMKSVRIKDFHPSLQHELGAPPPRALVINISKHGCVNFFVTMPKDFLFYPGLERAYKPFCEMMLDIVRRAC